MRTVEFSIEGNGYKLTIGEMIGIKEFYGPGGYSYMIENAIGMSGLYEFSERIKSTKGRVLEIKKTEKFNIAVLEFDE